jgi:hypothetical protein
MTACMLAPWLHFTMPVIGPECSSGMAVGHWQRDTSGDEFFSFIGIKPQAVPRPFVATSSLAPRPARTRPCDPCDHCESCDYQPVPRREHRVAQEPARTGRRRHACHGKGAPDSTACSHGAARSPAGPGQRRGPWYPGPQAVVASRSSAFESIAVLTRRVPAEMRVRLLTMAEGARICPLAVTVRNHGGPPRAVLA